MRETWQTLLDAANDIWLVVGAGHPATANGTQVGRGSLYVRRDAVPGGVLYQKFGPRPTDWEPTSSCALFDVRQYGARAAGGDDTAAIQATIDAALKTSGVVYLPQGTYRVGQLTTSRGSPTARIRLTGAGPGAVLKLIDGAESNILFASGVAALTVDNVSFDGNKERSSSALNCVRCDVSDAQFAHCRFQNANTNGIFATPGLAAPAARLAVVACQFIACGGTQQGYAVAVERTESIAIVGNLAEDCAAGLVDIEPTHAGARAADICVVGNVVRSTGNSLAAAGAIQLYSGNAPSPSGASAVSRAVIASNVVTTCGGHGIRIDNCAGVLVEGNSVYRAARHGIYISTSIESRDVVLLGNLVQECSTSAPGHFDGIHVEPIDSGVVIGNLVSAPSGQHRHDTYIASESTDVVTVLPPQAERSGARDFTGALPLPSGPEPDVRSGDLFLASNSQPVTVVFFAGGRDGQAITVVLDDYTTLAPGPALKLRDGLPFRGSSAVISLVCVRGVWLEISRSQNQ